MNNLALSALGQNSSETNRYEEQTNSDEEKHFDSIISSSEAYRIESRKSDCNLILKLKQKSKDFSLFQSKSSSEIKEIITKYKYSLETLSTGTLPIQESLCTKTETIRASIKKSHKERLSLLETQFEEKMKKLVDSKREKLQKYWRAKVLDLNGTLQQAEWNSNSKQLEEENNTKNKYERAFKEALKTEKNHLESEIEEHYYKQFQDKLNDLTPKSIFRDEDELRSSVEGELVILRVQERMKWDVEKKKLRESCEKIAEFEFSRGLKEREIEIRQNYQEIVREKIELFKIEELESKVEESESCPQSKDPWIEEAESELSFEQSSSYRSALLQNLYTEIYKNKQKIEVKLSKKDQENVFRETGDELSTTFELFKQETERFYKTQMKLFEDSARASSAEKIEEKIKENLALAEKEVFYKYMQNLEKQRNSLKKQFEEKESAELKKIREIHSKEKQDYAQFKAFKNIEISKLDLKIKSKLQKLENELAQFDVKLKEHKRKSEHRAPRIPNYVPATPSNPIHYCRSVLNDYPKHTPTELVPTCSSARGVHINHEFSSKVSSPFRKTPPKNTFVQTQTIEKTGQSSSVKSLSYDHSKANKQNLFATNKLKQNMYHELLKEKFGYIQPRLK